MPQLSALKVIDRALLPIVVVIAVKILGNFLGSLIFDINYVFNFSATVNNFLFFQFEDFESLSTIVNFSDTLLILTCGLALSWIIFQASNLNIDITHPTIINRIYKTGRNFWLTSNGQIYHQASVWLGLTWLVLFLILVDVYQNLTSTFVLGLSLAVTLGLTFIFYDFVRKS